MLGAIDSDNRTSLLQCYVNCILFLCPQVLFFPDEVTVITNALSYYAAVLITALKSFIVLVLKGLLQTFNSFSLEIRSWVRKLASIVQTNNISIPRGNLIKLFFH